MSPAEQTKNAFENKFTHNEELQFKVNNRRNKLLALWCADVLGKNLEEADKYVLEIIKISLVKGGDDGVFHKLNADLGDQVPDEAIRNKMAQLMFVAKDEVLGVAPNTLENVNNFSGDESIPDVGWKTDVTPGPKTVTRKSKLLENLKSHNRSWT